MLGGGQAANRKVVFFWMKESPHALHGGARGVGLAGGQAGPARDARPALKRPGASGWVHQTSFKFRTGKKNKPMHQNKSLDSSDGGMLLENRSCLGV